jgi:hypothetical protein
MADDAKQTLEGDAPATLAAVAQAMATLRAEIKASEDDAKLKREQFATLERQFLSLADVEEAWGITVDAEDIVVDKNGKRHRVPARFTVSPAERILADTPAGKDAAIAALKRSGKYAYLVKEDVNLSSLGALVREFDKDNRPLPPSFEGAVGIRRVPYASINKKSSK